MTGTTGERSVDGIRAAVGRICRWMDAHGAPLLVENLAPGATPGRLAQAEIEAATALPEDLRTLWSLHDGQREEGNGFIESYDLLSVEGALAQQETVLMCIGFAREAPHCTGVSADRLKQLAAAVTGAATTDRAALDDVLQRVRAKMPADTTAQAEASRDNWLSRLFGKRE